MGAALIAAALLRLGLASDVAYSHDSSLRTEARVQQVVPEGTDRTTNSALEVQPRLTLSAKTENASLALTYDPRFTHTSTTAATSSALGGGDTWLQLASLVSTWEPAKRWRVRGGATLTRGTNDLLRFLTTQVADGQAPPSAQLTPVVTTIDYQNVDASLSVDGQLSGRLSLSASLGATREGGLGTVALAYLPLQQSARIASGLDWRVTRRGTLGVTLSGSVAHYFDVPLSSTGGPGGAPVASWNIWTGRLGGVWRYALAKETSAYASSGLALVGGDGPGQVGLRALPAAEVGLTHTPLVKDLRLQGGLTLGLAPLEDRLGGTIVERTDLRAWVVWFPVDRWSLRGSASGGVVVSGQSKRDKLGSTDVRIGWAAAEYLELSVGMRGSMQDQPRLPTPRFAEWSAFLAAAGTYAGRF